MRFVQCLVCASLLFGTSLAHANQVQEVPPPPPAAPTTPAPTTPAPTTPAPTTDAPPADVPPPPPAGDSTRPPPPPAQAGGSVQWRSGVTSTGGSSAGAETHDGFFLRLALGLGAGFWSEQVETSTVFGGTFEMTGAAIGIDIAIGAVVAENLAVHASLFGTFLGDPKVTVDGEEIGTAEGVLLSGTAFGVGLTYYVMPLNVYLSGSLGLARATLTVNSGTDDARSAETDTGYALNLIVGKEWWVSEQWGLGVALQIVHVNVPDLDTRLKGTGVHLMFSATYN